MLSIVSYCYTLVSDYLSPESPRSPLLDGGVDGGVGNLPKSPVLSGRVKRQSTDNGCSGGGGTALSPDPVYQPCDIQCKIADLGNACWTVNIGSAQT